MKRLCLVEAAAALCLGACAGDMPSFFRNGDVWVLSGDSITAIGLYQQTVRDVLDHFHPGNRIKVVGTGVWGQLAEEAAGKGLRQKPTVVSIMLGMNNVIHGNYAENTDFSRRIGSYVAAIRKQVRQYKAQGADVVLMQPTLPDERENSFFGPARYTERGGRLFGEAVRALCDEEQCRFVPVADEFEAAKSELLPMQNLVVDGVHPYGWGQYVIARSLVHHLNVAAPLAMADEGRGFVASGLPARDMGFRPKRRFLADATEAPELEIVSPVQGRAVVQWSVEGSPMRGEESVKFSGSPLAFRPSISAEGLPSAAGRIARLIVSVTPEADRRPRMAVVDLARTRVVRMVDGACSGEIRTDVQRPEGPLVSTWKVEERGPDLWISGRAYASSYPARPKPPAETWMNVGGMNGFMVMLDLRPADRFADNNFDRDMHMAFFSVLNDPWAVLPLVWESRRLSHCFYGHAEPTPDGYAWRMGVRGHVLDYQPFDIRKFDHFGFNLIAVDADEKGEIGLFPAMPYVGLKNMTPEQRLNQTIVVDRKGDVPQSGGETTNVGVFVL